MLQSPLLTFRGSRRAFTCRQKTHIHILRFHNVNKETRRTGKKKKKHWGFVFTHMTEFREKKSNWKWVMSMLNMGLVWSFSFAQKCSNLTVWDVTSQCFIAWLLVSQHLWATWFIFLCVAISHPSIPLTALPTHFSPSLWLWHYNVLYVPAIYKRTKWLEIYLTFLFPWKNPSSGLHRE